MKIGTNKNLETINLGAIAGRDVRKIGTNENLETRK